MGKPNSLQRLLFGSSPVSVGYRLVSSKGRQSIWNFQAFCLLLLCAYVYVSIALRLQEHRGVLLPLRWTDTARPLCRCAAYKGRQTVRQGSHGKQTQDVGTSRQLREADAKQVRASKGHQGQHRHPWQRKGILRTDKPTLVLSQLQHGTKQRNQKPTNRNSALNGSGEMGREAK